MKNKLKRIYAIIIRHMYVWVKNWSRISDSLYWPVLSLILWGYVSTYLAQQGNNPNLFLAFIGGYIFWNVMQRSEEELTVGMMEDLWNRNFINIFASPVTLWEYLIALVIMGIFKVIISTFIIWMIALFVFNLNLLSIGIYLIPFIVNLFFVGWWMGLLTSGLIFRFGYDVEALSWTIIFILQPFSAVFFPLSVLPSWMQGIAHLVPSSYIFEGLRSLVFKGEVNPSLIIISSLLNIFYMIICLVFYKKMFDIAREKGFLTKLF